MNIAVYPGSFDPITIGHLDIIERACHVFDKVIIAIMVNPKKIPTFTSEERKVMIERSVSHLSNVEVVIGSGLTVDLAHHYHAKALIRGIRAVADYEYELQQATANMALADDIETIFFVSRPEYSFISSSSAKEIAYYGASLKGFVPEIIEDQLKKRMKK